MEHNHEALTRRNNTAITIARTWRDTIIERLAQEGKPLDPMDLGLVLDIEAGSLGQILEVGIHIGMRRADIAPQLIQAFEDARVDHHHPLDEYCLPRDILDDIVAHLTGDA